MTLRPAILAAAVLLAACSADPDPAPPANIAADTPAAAANAAAPATPAAAPVLAIEGEGLRLINPASGAARPLAFGTAQPALLSALAFRGAPETSRLEECGAGPLDQAGWPDGLALYFQDGKFVGWALSARGSGRTSPPALTTAAGIGLGSTRAELDAAYSAKVFESTLGTEFAAGDLFGLLDGKGPRARITNLWAGASCNFR